MAQDFMNGHTHGGMADWTSFVNSRPKETSPFVVGGQTLAVPVLSLWDVKRHRTRIDSMTPEMHWLDFTETVLRIVAMQLAPNAPDDAAAEHRALMEACSMEEQRQLGTQWTALLRASGFLLGEAEAAQEAANPGTGMSTESPQTSLFEEFVEGTPLPSSSDSR